MKRKIIEKKRIFRYCTAILATTLLVGTDCSVTFAKETENAKTIYSSLIGYHNIQYWKIDTDSGGIQAANEEIANVVETISDTTDNMDETPPYIENDTNIDDIDETPPYIDDISEISSEYETDNFLEDNSNISDEEPDTDNTYSTEESEESDIEQLITVNNSLCICNIQCDNSNINENCPICVEDFENCAVVPTVEDELDKIVDEMSEDIVLYDLDTIFDYNGLLYRVLSVDDNKVEIIGSSNYTSTLSGSLEIPNQISYNNNTYIVTAIGSSAFLNFNTLTEIALPDSVTTIGNLAFYQCTNLKTVTIPDSVYINDQAFRECSKLDTLKIRIKSNDSISLVSIKDIDVFNNCPDPRNIVFVSEDGTTELDNATAPRLVTAVNAYKAVNDGDNSDYKWYGWNLKIPTFKVTVNVQKDNAPWNDHNRSFILKDSSNNESSEIITDLNAVKNGTYLVFDITDTQDTANGLDTGVKVTVNDDDISTDPINYYTVTFYDEQTPYDIGTPQEPQIILKEYKAAEPTAPTKEGYIFNGWKTSIEGDTDFNFDTSITNTTPVYASWIEEPKQPDGDDDSNNGDTDNDDSNNGDIGNDDSNNGDTGNDDSNTDGGNGDTGNDDSNNGGDNGDSNNGGGNGDTGNDDSNNGGDNGDSNNGDTGNGDSNTGDTGNGDSNTGDTGNGDSNTDGGNDNSNTGSGNDNNNQNTSSENSNLGNSNNSSNTSSNTSTNSNTPSTQTDVSTSQPVIDTTLNAVFLDNTAANSITNSIDNNITDNNNSDEGNHIDSAKDNEPKTGEESNTGIYTIIAIAAGLVLLLLHLFEQKNTFTQIDEAQSKCSKIITIIPFDKYNRKWNNNNPTRGVLCTIRKKYFYLSG